MPCHPQCMGVSPDQDHVTCNYHLTRTRLSLVPLPPLPLHQPSPSTAIDEQREAHTRIKKTGTGPGDESRCGACARSRLLQNRKEGKEKFLSIMLSGPLPRLENEKRKKMKILVTEKKKKKKKFGKIGKFEKFSCHFLSRNIYIKEK